MGDSQEHKDTWTKLILFMEQLGYQKDKDQCKRVIITLTTVFKLHYAANVILKY